MVCCPISNRTILKFTISQSEANSTVLISYDIESLAWYPTISWSLSSKVMLTYNKLQRSFANTQTTCNLRFSWCFAIQKRCKECSRQTKLEDANQLCQQVLKHSDWNNGVGVTKFFSAFEFHYSHCITLKVKLFFIHHFLPCLLAFVNWLVLFSLRATRYNAWQILLPYVMLNFGLNSRTVNT